MMSWGDTDAVMRLDHLYGIGHGSDDGSGYGTGDGYGDSLDVGDGYGDGNVDGDGVVILEEGK